MDALIARTHLLRRLARAERHLGSGTRRQRTAARDLVTSLRAQLAASHRGAWERAALFDGIERIVITYNGGGDHGAIDSIAATDRAGGEVVLSPAAERLVEERVYDCLPGGWENNEGGFGEATITIAQNEISLSHNNYCEQEEESSHDLSAEGVIAEALACIPAETLALLQAAGIRGFLLTSDGWETAGVVLDERSRRVSVSRLADGGASLDTMWSTLAEWVRRMYPIDREADDEVDASDTESYRLRVRLDGSVGTVEITWTEQHAEGDDHAMGGTFLDGVAA